MDQSPSVTERNPAQIYEDFYVPCIFRPWTEEILDRARPQAGDRILDLACGTGIVARTVAGRLNGNVQVTGVDFSPLMLAVARSSSTSELLDIEWVETNVEHLPFPDESFDLVVIQQGLQFLGDKTRAATEMHRVLVNGGRVVSSTWTDIENNPFNKAFAVIVRRHLGIPEESAAFSFGDRQLLTSLFVDTGFEQVETEVVRRVVRYPSPDRFVELGVASASVAVPEFGSMDAAERDALVEAIRDDMVAPIEQYTVDGEILSPMEAQIVVARKSEKYG